MKFSCRGLKLELKFQIQGERGPGMEKIIDLKYSLFSDFQGEYPSTLQRAEVPLVFQVGCPPI